VKTVKSRRRTGMLCSNMDGLSKKPHLNRYKKHDREKFFLTEGAANSKPLEYEAGTRSVWLGKTG
jgi:hypothetical protein